MIDKRMMLVVVEVGDGERGPEALLRSKDGRVSVWLDISVSEARILSSQIYKEIPVKIQGLMPEA